MLELLRREAVHTPSRFDRWREIGGMKRAMMRVQLFQCLQQHRRCALRPGQSVARAFFTATVLRYWQTQIQHFAPLPQSGSSTA